MKNYICVIFEFVTVYNVIFTQLKEYVGTYTYNPIYQLRQSIRRFLMLSFNEKLMARYFLFGIFPTEN